MGARVRERARAAAITRAASADQFGFGAFGDESAGFASVGCAGFVSGVAGFVAGAAGFESAGFVVVLVAGFAGSDCLFVGVVTGGTDGAGFVVSGFVSLDFGIVPEAGGDAGVVFGCGAAASPGFTPIAALPAGAGDALVGPPVGAAVPGAAGVSVALPVAGGVGALLPVGSSIIDAPLPVAEPAADPWSAFSFASSFCSAAFACSAPNFSSASLESWLAMNASTIDVAMKMKAEPAVTLRRNVDAPEPPNTVPALLPPNAPPMPPPLPDCKSTVSIRNRHTMTCRIVISVDMRA
jgi:hypothetical protein